MSTVNLFASNEAAFNNAFITAITKLDMVEQVQMVFLEIGLDTGTSALGFRSFSLLECIWKECIASFWGFECFNCSDACYLSSLLSLVA
ncbi:hypothetical protein HN51_007897 [Arachis hypogaea]